LNLLALDVFYPARYFPPEDVVKEHLNCRNLLNVKAFKGEKHFLYLGEKQ